MDGLRQRHAVARELAAPKRVPSLSSASSSSSSDDGLDPFTPPDFTIKDLLGAIPAHCFERSALRSSSYIAMDLCFVGACVWAASFIDPAFGLRGSVLDGRAGQLARYALWAVYAFCAGLPGTGLWVIAHECGHQAFSPSKTINNAVGWVLHSALLVPYHSWRISHAKHHAATGHMTRDQVFVPKTRTQRGLPPLVDDVKPRGGDETTLEKLDDLLEDAPLYTFLSLVVQQLVGWPAYILTNASGQRNYPKHTNHFNPDSIIFDKRHRHQVLLSDLGIALTLGALAYWGSQRGFLEVARLYVAPYLWVNHWLVLITYLQHTDPKLPHYREKEWNFQRGALCTVDRNCFGFFMHGIAETHVLHHTCSKIPHYHAWEASEALKAVLGSHYMYDPTPVFPALWHSYDQCRFVEDDGQVVFYKNAQGQARRKVVYAQPVSDSGVDVN